MTTVATTVALLRGVNVGRAKRVSMADLREVFTSLGYGDVRTVLQSGNVVFTASRAPGVGAVTAIEQALQASTGVQASVLLLAAADVAAIAAAHPVRAISTHPPRAVVTFLAGLRRIVSWHDDWVAASEARARAEAEISQYRILALEERTPERQRELVGAIDSLVLDETRSWGRRRREKVQAEPAG